MSELRDDTVALLSDLIGFPTVTAASNLDLIAYAQARLEEVGADIQLSYDADGMLANLLARIGPDVVGGVVLSGHTDVVPADPEGWTSPPYVATLRDGAIHGRGAADMKGFIACVLAMAPRFAAADLARPVHVALTFDEEVGCLGAPLLIDQLAAGPLPAAAIVGEPTELAIVEAHKGCYEYTTEFLGTEGHASSPRAGVNAVEYAARFVAALLELGEELRHRAPADSPFDPPETTVSVGRIDGGSARNVIAGTCTVEWEFRPVTRGDADLVLERVRALEDDLRGRMRAVDPEVGVTTTTIGAVDGLDPDPDDVAATLVADLLDNPPRTVVSFGTEAGLYQRRGIPAVVCGPGSITVAHQPDEHVALAQLERCLAMLDRLRHHLSVPVAATP